jgi:hypothetical protein
MGDYFDMISDNNTAHLAWANTLNSEQDVYYGRITPLVTGLSSVTAENTILTLNAGPNPFGESTRLSYSLSEASEVRLELLDMTGRKIAILVDQPQTKGSYTISLDGSKLNKGIYFCSLTSGKERKSIRLVKVE